MAGRVVCGPEPARLPSLTGTDAGELEEYLPPLPSRRRVVELVREALAEMEKSRDPVLLMLVAEWGEGKTSVFNAVVEPWARARGWLVLRARGAAVAALLRRLSGAVDPAVAVSAAVLAAGLEAARLLAEHGAPPEPGEARGWVLGVLRRLRERGAGGLLVFLDEVEDLVAGASEEMLGLLAAGLVGLVNGELEAVSARCRGEDCLTGFLHLVAGLTPPAYSRLMGLRDFATVAARLRRRMRVVWIRPLPRREALAFLESLARFSLGAGLDALLDDHGLGNALVSGSLGNMGALVSAFRYVVGWALERGRRMGCRGVARLGAEELLEALQGLTLSVGGAELPAVNQEALQRLMEGWEARAKLAALPREAAEELMVELLARGAVGLELLSRRTGLGEKLLEAMVAEANLYAEQGWLRRELGVRRLLYRVRLVPRVEDAFKLLRAVEPEAARIAPGLAPAPGRGSPLEELVDSLVYSDAEGRQVVAVPAAAEEAADLVADASPVELGRGEAEALGKLLWDRVFSRLQLDEGEPGLLVAPRVQRLVYVSPELGYLDFIADRGERLRLVRRVYAENDPAHLLVGAVALLSAAGMVSSASPQAGAARLELRLPSGAEARALLVALPGEVTGEAARRIGSLVSAAVLSGWRPHLVLVVHQGGVEPAAARLLEQLEEQYFLRVVRLGLQSLVSRVKLQALGAKLAEEAGGLEEALRLAQRIPAERGLAESLGFEPMRLQQVLRELADEVRLRAVVERALEEGVSGAPLAVRDPRLGYDVERPTELAGALRYFLAVPAAKASPREALEAAYEYLQRYVIPRGGGGEPRGLLSPDIERGETGTLEKYMLILAANGFLEKLNGSVRVDVLAPMERSVLRALEQLGAREDWVPAARLWELLVVEARNPGTRRMLLQSLAYRGLVEPSSPRRLDPERTRLRLRDTPEAAEQLIEEARGLLGKLRGAPEAQTWGVFLATKARGLRGGTLEALAAKAEQLLGLAGEALRAGSLLTALRLATVARDALSYALEELLPLAREAAREAAALRRRIEEIRDEARAMMDELEALLGGIAPGARLSREPLRVLEEALEGLERVEEERITEEKLDQEARRLWEEARRRNPRRPGEATPFYIHGSGPALRYNYRLWLATRLLEEKGLARLTPGGVELVEPGWLRSLREALETLRGALEQAADARRLAERLGERLARLVGEPGGVPAPALPRLEAPKEPIGPQEALQLAREAAAVLQDARRPLLEAEEQLARLEEELERLGELRAEAETWLRLLRNAVEAAGEAGLPAAGRLEEALRDLELALRQAEEQRLRGLSRLHGAGDRLAARLREARELVESAAILLRDSLEQAKRALREARDAAERLAEALAAEAEALEEALRAAGLEPPERPRLDDPFRAVAVLRRHLDKLRGMIEEAGLLSGRELEAYRLVASERRRRGELLFREAVMLVAERLRVEAGEARRLLLRLIEKGVLEPRL